MLILVTTILTFFTLFSNVHPLELKSSLLKHDFIPKVGIIGSGNWGSAVARRVGLNLEKVHIPEPIDMWVYEEEVGGRKLTDIINTDHENVKYLPGIQLPKNILANPDLLASVHNKNILFFVVPHQYLSNVLCHLKGQIASDTICVSLIKGVDVSMEDGLRRYTEIIAEELGVSQVAAVMGANVANDVAKDLFAETTVASVNTTVTQLVSLLLHSERFRTEQTTDISTVEFCGALKNVVALGAGICDGMNMGHNTKAAIIRRGLEEMAQFCQLFDRTGLYQVETLLKSCGVADLIATGYGGRNRLCSAEFTKRCLAYIEDKTAIAGSGQCEFASVCPNRGSHKSPGTVCALWQEIEAQLLQGQKLQGVSTCEEVIKYLEKDHLKKYPRDFPLFRSIHRIVVDGECCDTLFAWDEI
eukprot:gene6867-7592_t